MIDNELERFASERVGMINYASKTWGAFVLFAYAIRPISHSYFSWLIAKPDNIGYANVMLDNDDLKKTWCFEGSVGKVTLRLDFSIIPTNFTIDNVAKEMSPDFTATPQNVTVYGFLDPKDVDQNGIPLLSATYDINGTQTQTWPVQWENNREETYFEYFKLQIWSNYGNPNYTCLFIMPGKIKFKRCF